MKMYLKLFLVMGIPFGLAMGLLNALTKNLEYGIQSGIVAGIFFGLFMSLIHGTIHKLKTKKMGIASDISPTQSTTIELGSNLDLAFEKSIQSLNQFGAKIKSRDKTKSEIRATSGMTWKSWGEALTVRLNQTGDQKVKIEITSSPKLKTTLVDYGKGRQNVDKMARLLMSGNI